MRLLLLLVLFVPYVFNEEFLLEDQCYLEEVPNFSLQQVLKGGSTLDLQPVNNRTECYRRCCSDEFQIGIKGRCTAAAYYKDPSGDLVCQLLECTPSDKCLWAPGSPGKFAGFIRSTKTTTTTLTTTTTTEVVTKAPSVVTQQQNNNNNNNGNTMATNNNNNTPGHAGDAQTGVPSGGTDGADAHAQGGTNQQQGNETVTMTTGNSHPSHPDTVHIEHVRRGHSIPIKGLVAGIVLAVLLLIVLISFLVKQLRAMRPPVQYKPIYEEEYQKLTHEEA